MSDNLGLLDARKRLVLAALLAIALVLLEAVAPVLFAPAVALALIVAPFINWLAFWRLRERRRRRMKLGQPEIRSLRTAYFNSMLLAIASTVLAMLGVFTGLRVLHLVDAIPAQVFLLLLAYPCLLMTGPAFEWLALIAGD